MSWKVSKAVRNHMLEFGDLKHTLSNCFIKWYTGAQPANGEAAPTGTLLVTLSLSSGAITREVLSVGSVDLTGGGAGSVDTITVNGIEIMGSSTPFNTSLAVTAADVSRKINDNPRNYLFTTDVTATDQINIRAKPGMGTLPNGWVVASTVTTITKVDSNMAGGVSPINGLNWGDSAAGVLAKLITQVWSGVAVATGTAGWFRIEASVSDAGGVDSTESIFRADGTIATSGGEINMGSTSITTGLTYTLDTFTITLPTL
jgi:hypothetical protein